MVVVGLFVFNFPPSFSIQSRDKHIRHVVNSSYKSMFFLLFYSQKLLSQYCRRQSTQKKFHCCILESVVFV